MLDIKSIRENLEAVKARLDRRRPDTSKGLAELLAKEEERRGALSEVEGLKSQKKKISAEVGKLKQAGKDASVQMEEVKTINTSIKDLDEKTRQLENEVAQIILGIPNLPDDSIPDGKDETANQFVREWGEKPKHTFAPKTHVEIGESLDLLDFKRAAKISGSRFAVYKGAGAQLLRAPHQLHDRCANPGKTAIRNFIRPFWSIRKACWEQANCPNLRKTFSNCETTRII